MQGYASPEYQQVYAKHGEVRDGMIYRQIPGTPYTDRISVYPFYPLEDVAKSHTNEITTTLITDPLTEHYSPITCFLKLRYKSSQEKYKDHAVVKLKDFDESKLPENHKRNIKKCNKECYVDVVTNKQTQLDFFNKCYENLKARHNISENAWTNYSMTDLHTLMNVPGAVLFKSSWEEFQTLGYDLFYIQSDCVYYHIGCLSESGYDHKANFLMMFEAIKFFKGLGLDRLEIGSVPDGASGDGLRRFKQGFANMSLPNHIYKIIHNKGLYGELSKGKEDSVRFPKYRL